MTDFIIAEEIGSGEFGTVSKGTVKSTGIDVALKMLKHDTPEAREMFVKEADRLTSLSHINIVCCIGTQFHLFPYMIVFEYMSYGDLKTYLASIDEKLQLTHQVKLAYDVSQGGHEMSRVGRGPVV